MRKLFTLLFFAFSFFLGKGQYTCQAWFYPQITAGSDTVAFMDFSYNTDSSQIVVNSWQWTFGDNTSSTQQNPIHVYPGAGTYYVCLTITANSVCSSTFCDTIVITSGGSSGCNANFYSYPDTSSTCTSCSYFYDNSTGTGLSYYWSFGDNTYDTIQNPHHSYNASGYYTVCLTISNNSGCQSTYCDSIYVGGGILPGCNAYFYSYPDTNNHSLLNFVDYSTGNPTSWLWSFGDGSTSTSQYPQHTYQSTGTYNVCLIINTANCVDTFCTVIAVSAGNNNNCLLYLTSTIVPESYTGASNGSIDITVNQGSAPFTYFWTNNATTQDIYNLSEGYYDVSVTDSAGCSTFASFYVPDSSNTNTTIGTLLTIPQDTCLNFSYDTVSVYLVNVIDSFTVAVTWIFLETNTGQTAFLIDTFSITNQGYYSVSITVTCSQKSTHIYYDHILVDYGNISLNAANNKLDRPNLDLYPNPINDQLNLRFRSTESGKIRIRLVDISGRIILDKDFSSCLGINTYQINTTTLNHGIYFINLISGNKVINKKIVK